MHFIRPILLAAAFLTLSVIAAPVPTSAASFDLSARGADAPNLVRRVLSQQDLSKAILETQKRQALKKTVAKDNKKKLNQATMDAVGKVKASAAKTEGKTAQQRKTLHQKANDKAWSQAITAKQKQAKDDRRQGWEAKKKHTDKPPRAPKPPRGPRPAALARAQIRNDKKAELKTAFTNAANGLRDTDGFITNGRPLHSKDKFTVGRATVTGKDVRTAVMNTYLHSPAPLGFQQHPKTFNNEPYAPTHPETDLQGKRVVENPDPSGASMGLKEYPVIPVKTQPHGWLGDGSVGPIRVLTSTQGGNHKFHGVIGHDSTRDGDGSGGNDNHYLSTYKPYKKN